MSACKILLSLALISLPIAGYSMNCTATYTDTGMLSGFWGVGLNWGGMIGDCYPGQPLDMPGDTATFTGVSASTPVTLIDALLMMPINPSITTLTFNTAGSYTINPDSLTTPMSSLNFDPGPGSSIAVNTGNQLIQAPVNWSASSPLTVTVVGGSTLTFNGNIGGSTLVYNGPGTFINTNQAMNNVNQTFTLTGTAALPGGTGALDIESGIFQITNNFLVTGTGVGVTFSTTDPAGHIIINGGTLALLNTGENDLAAGVHFTNTSNNANIFLQAGTCSITNTGPITGLFGTFCDFTNGALIISPGTTMTVNNTGALTNMAVAGALGGFTTMTFNGGSGGTITVENSGNISTAAIGALLNAELSATMNLGTLTVVNTGSVTGGAEAGAQFFCNTFVQNGGLVQVQQSSPQAILPPGANFNGDVSITVNSNGVFSNDESTTSNIFTQNAGTFVTGVGTFSGAISFALSDTVFNNNGGTLIPGDPADLTNITPLNTPGVMNIVGTYNQVGGIFSVTVADSTLFNSPGPTTYSQLAVTSASGLTGTASLSGSVEVALTPDFVIHNGDTITILTTTGGLGGTTFNPDIINYNIPFYITTEILYDPDMNVLLRFLVNNPPPSSPAFHQSIFASINHTHTRLERQMQNLRYRFCIKEAPKCIPKPKPCAKPRSKSCYKEASVEETLPVQAVSDLVDSQDTSEFLSWFRVPEERQTQNDACEEMRDCCAESRHWNVYFGPTGTVGEVHTKHSQPGYDEWSVGGLAGFDYAFSEGGIGFMVDYENIKGRVHQHWGKFDINQAHASLYSTYAPKSAHRLSFDAIVGGGYDWFDIHRRTSEGTAKGKPRGKEFDALFGLAYNFYGRQDCCRPTKFQVTPMANLQYIYLDTSRYNEHGADPFDFKVHGQVDKSLRSTLGTWISYGWDRKNFSFTPEIYLAWQREYFDHNHSLYVTPLDIVGPTSKQTVRGAGRNTFQAGLDLMFTLFEFYGIEASYDFEWNSLFHDQAFYVGFNVEF